jgi:hypothetical protein
MAVKRRKGEGQGGFGRLGRPTTRRAEEKGSWADAERLRRPSGLGKERRQRPSGLKLRRKKISISFFLF